jgi:putative ABC transport system permease protein
LLLRTPIFSAVIIVVLALGIGANSAIFSVVNAVLLRPLPYHEPERLYRLEEVDPKGDPQGVSQLDLEAFRQRSNLIEQVGLSRWQNFTLTGREGQENLYGGKVSSTCFPMLGVQPVAGRGFRDDDFHPGAPGVVLISDRLWQRRYARDPRAIGKQLMMNGAGYTIAGVMPPAFFFEQRFELWIPWQFRGRYRQSAVALLCGGSTAPGRHTGARPA